jgi:hypothetical protein
MFDLLYSRVGAGAGAALKMMQLRNTVDDNYAHKKKVT